MANLEDMTQDDIDRMEKALDRYKKENERFRTERDEFKAAAEGNEANAAFRERAVKAEAKLRLASAGVKDADRLAKYLDLSKVEFDEEGNIKGLDEQIEGLKGDFAEVFDPKRRVGGLADAGPRNAVETGPKSVTEMQVAKLFGN